MRSKAIRQHIPLGLTLPNFENVISDVSKFTSDVQAKIADLQKTNPTLYNAIKTGSTTAYQELRNRGIISQEMYNKLIGQQQAPPPAETDNSKMLILGGIAIGAAFLLLNK
jgi:hypothetical protein